MPTSVGIGFSPTEYESLLRRILRDELKVVLEEERLGVEEIVPVVIPHKLDPDGSLGFRNGVAHPITMLDIETRELRLLFGGWTGAGYPRSLFIASLDPETLEVSGIRRFLSPTDLGINSLDFVYPFYDRINDRYLLFCYIRDESFSDSKMAIIAMDRELTTVKGIQKIAPSTGINDSRPIPIGFEDKSMILLRSDSSATKIYPDAIADWTTSLPLPYTEADSNNWITWHEGIWVEDVVKVGEQMTVLIERCLPGLSGLWGLTIGFGPLMAKNIIVDTALAIPEASRIPLGAQLEHTSHLAHAHCSIYTKRPTLFFVYYMDEITDTSINASWRHEIWAMRVRPEVLFDINRYKPLKTIAAVNSTYSKYIPVFGKDITIIVNSSATGTLTVEHYPSYFATKPEATGLTAKAMEIFQINAGYNKINISNPAPIIRLAANASFIAWVIHW